MNLITKLGKICDYVVRNEDNLHKFLSYLVKYGYLDESADSKLEDLVDIITILQDMAGLNKTGIINEKTLKVLDWPRCGCKDIFKITEAASGTPKWGMNHLRYCITGYDNEMSRGQWGDSIREALNRIEAVCGLTFEEVNSINAANIVYGVGSGRQDDFDGSSGTLAWMQLCPAYNYRGQVDGKFDLAETWLPYGKNGRGIFLVNVACHETCHALGLRHSQVNSALMAPYYSATIDKPQQNDDITRLVSLYGNPTTIPTPTPLPNPEPANSQELIIRVNNQVALKIKVPIGRVSMDGYRVQKIS